MRIVIQCAGRKQGHAGTFRWEGRRVAFVARPDVAPADKGSLFAHPDDATPSGEMSWRQWLVRYNATGENPQRLLQAADLYTPPIYDALGKKFGRDRFYILSAGWGLVRSDFLLPDYDITFVAAEEWKIREDGNRFDDFNHLAADASLRADEWLVFFGTPAYGDLFRRLTRRVPAKKLMWCRVESRSNEGLERARELRVDGDGFGGLEFRTTSRTNWHYRCAEAFLRKPLELG